MQITPFGWTLAAAVALACHATTTDPEIERSVARQIASEASLRGYPIEVASLGGEVRLVGQVASQAHRLRAEAIAERVPGVHFVRNHLHVSRPRRPALESSALGRPGRPYIRALP
jgi:hypothetical protein